MFFYAFDPCLSVVRSPQGVLHNLEGAPVSTEASQPSNREVEAVSVHGGRASEYEGGCCERSPARPVLASSVLCAQVTCGAMLVYLGFRFL